MDIQYISLTGADNNVDINDLKKLSLKYPKVEWAILMFPERDGCARNPTIKWREKFYAEKLPNTALHLCGSAINKFAEEDSSLMKEIKNFTRVQINLKPQYANKELVIQLTEVVKKNSNIEFITQYNEVNTEYFQYWNDVVNHNYLFDASLGKGLTPENWLPPVENKKCGYAGGLNPNNLLLNLLKIKKVAQNQKIWIDMETGLRTNDQFDLDKVRSVLDIYSHFEKD